ncbi:Rv3235 family protein [Streptomyces spectabilis]|uniref:Rv3235 family protein n=1 Tax=Streptomyces spectabilis TaxID=68270 RepID=UPI001CEFA20C|nr:Rv3235 family protein [Streptomyces spectabilis]
MPQSPTPPPAATAAPGMPGMPGMPKVMTRPRRPSSTRPAASRPPAGRPPGRPDPRRPGSRSHRVPAQPPPHPAELFTELLLLVLSGQRPVHAVARHVAHTAYDDLVRLAELLPLRSVGGHRPAVRRVGHYEVRPGVYEVFARVGAGPALRALAFRLHRGDDERWRCTAVEVDSGVRHRV